MKNYIIVVCSAWLIAGTASVLAWYDPGYYHNQPPWSGPDQQRPVYGQSGFAERVRIRIERGVYEEGYLLRVYTQGINPEDIAVTAERGRIRLHTEMTSRQDSQDRYHRSMLSFHSRFSRTIRLPYDADPENISTTVTNDVLEIRIPRR